VADPQGRHPLLANVTITAVYDEDGTHVGFPRSPVTSPDVAARGGPEASENVSGCWSTTVEDYAIFMLDPTDTSPPGTPAPNAARLHRRGDHRPALPRLLPPERQAEGHPSTSSNAPCRKVTTRRRGGGSARTHPLLGRRHHHSGARREREACRLRQGNPRHHRAVLQRQDKERAAATMAARTSSWMPRTSTSPRRRGAGQAAVEDCARASLAGRRAGDVGRAAQAARGRNAR
jgi:hypothetical protein